MLSFPIRKFKALHLKVEKKYNGQARSQLSLGSPFTYIGEMAIGRKSKVVYMY